MTNANASRNAESLIEQALLDWDGRHTAPLQAVYQAWPNSYSMRIDDYCAEHLLRYANADTNVIPYWQSGLTWLLLHYQRDRHQPPVTVTVAEYIQAVLPQVYEPQASLHILQGEWFAPIASDYTQTVDAFLRKNLQAQQAIVRAWSYHGWAVLAQQHPGYRQEALQLLRMGARDEPASCKARIKHCIERIKKEGWYE